MVTVMRVPPRPAPHSRRADHSRREKDDGMALLCALLMTALLSTLGGTLVVLVLAEQLASARHRASLEGLYAAEAGIERAIGELRLLPGWQTLPGPGTGSASPDFNDGASTARLADGTVLDLGALTIERQVESDAAYPSAADRPVWRLFAHACLDRVIEGGAGTAPSYVLVWIADDPDDLDGDPARDSNDVVMVRAQVFGVGRIRRAVEVVLRRHSALDAAGGGGTLRTDVDAIAWREVR